MHGKQSAYEEVAKNKKDAPPPRKVGGIAFREPSTCRRVVVDWSNDDEYRGETL
jgi:hypothetical protein